MRQSDIDSPGDKPLVRALLVLDASLDTYSVDPDDAAQVEAMLRDNAEGNPDARYFIDDTTIHYDALFLTLYEGDVRLPLAESALFSLVIARRVVLKIPGLVLATLLREPSASVRRVKVLLSMRTWSGREKHGLLSIAAVFGQLAIVEYFIDSNVSEVSDVLIVSSARAHQFDVFKWLVTRGADIHTDDDMVFPEAARGGRVDVLEWFIDTTSGVPPVTHVFRSAFCLAVIHNHIEVVRFLLDANRPGLESVYLTAMSNAASLKFYDLFVFLLDNRDMTNDSVMTVSRPLVYTVFYYAIEDKRMDIVRTLIDRYDVDVHVGDNAAVRLAAELGDIDALAWLVEHGADIHAADDHAVRIAYDNEHHDAVKWLVERGANVDALAWARSSRTVQGFYAKCQNTAKRHRANTM